MMPQRRILIREDDDDIRTTLARYLSEHGFSTAEASKTSDCLSLCKENFPDLLLTYRTFHFQEDVDFVKQLRSDPAIPLFPIIIMGVEPPLDKQYYSAGANTCIGVVFDLTYLLDEINRVLKTSS